MSAAVPGHLLLNLSAEATKQKPWFLTCRRLFPSHKSTSGRQVLKILLKQCRETTSADAFGSGYDMIFVSAVIHINSPEENKLLISKCSGALNPQGQLVILDHFMNETGQNPWWEQFLP